jgi:small subunit ribosomal protein S9
LNSKAFFHATGRRKSAVARVRLLPGEGAIVVNGRPYDEIFTQERLKKSIMEPLTATDTIKKFSISVKVTGGGIVGQAGAVRHGISRALLAADENLRPILRGQGFLTRDSRVKERKKYGLVRARKSKQYSKR